MNKTKSSDTILVIKNVHKSEDIKKCFNKCYEKYIIFMEKRL